MRLELESRLSLGAFDRSWRLGARRRQSWFCPWVLAGRYERKYLQLPLLTSGNLRRSKIASTGLERLEARTLRWIVLNLRTHRIYDPLPILAVGHLICEVSYRETSCPVQKSLEKIIGALKSWRTSAMQANHSNAESCMARFGDLYTKALRSGSPPVFSPERQAANAGEPKCYGFSRGRYGFKPDRASVMDQQLKLILSVPIVNLHNRQCLASQLGSKFWLNTDPIFPHGCPHYGSLVKISSSVNQYCLLLNLDHLRSYDSRLILGRIPLYSS